MRLFSKLWHVKNWMKANLFRLSISFDSPHNIQIVPDS